MTDTILGLCLTIMLVLMLTGSWLVGDWRGDHRRMVLLAREVARLEKGSTEC